MQQFRSGDTIKHKPTGETWVLAWADDLQVSPCGWPESIARVSDCELVTAATDKEHREMILSWAEKDHKQDDFRVLKCGEILQAMTNQQER